MTWEQAVFCELQKFANCGRVWSVEDERMATRITAKFLKGKRFVEVSEPYDELDTAASLAARIAGRRTLNLRSN